MAAGINRDADFKNQLHPDTPKLGLFPNAPAHLSVLTHAESVMQQGPGRLEPSAGLFRFENGWL